MGLASARKLILTNTDGIRYLSTGKILCGPPAEFPLFFSRVAYLKGKENASNRTSWRTLISTGPYRFVSGCLSMKPRWAHYWVTKGVRYRILSDNRSAEMLVLSQPCRKWQRHCLKRMILVMPEWRNFWFFMLLVQDRWISERMNLLSSTGSATLSTCNGQV